MLERVLSVPSVRSVNARLEAGSSPSLGGAWGSSSALILAALQQVLRRPLLVLTADPEEMAEDLQTFGTGCTLLPEIAGDNRFVHSERRRIADTFRVLVATPRSAGQPLPETSVRLEIRKGEKRDLPTLVDQLVENKYEHVHAVEAPGEFSHRGGILDVFPVGSDRPVRLDFFGNFVDSIREFTVHDQRSAREYDAFSLSVANLDRITSPLALPENAWIALVDDAQTTLRAPTLSLQPLPIPGENVKVTSLQRFSGILSNVAAELEKLTGEVLVYCANEGEEQRLREIVTRPITVRRGRIAHGFSFEGMHFIAHHELFNRHRLRRSMMKRPDARPIDSMLELEKGDVVVHLYHGIGLFVGMQALEGKEFMVLEYADAARVYVPVADLDLVQKYVGTSEHAPPLHTLGGTSWSSAKEKAQQAVEELAKEMVQIQAVREMELGTSFPADTEWQHAFETSFPYEETTDQLEVAREIKLDLQSPRPMDRLVCGDVGYGKTELAMRAAFRVATSNKQVAVLVPTTVLAEQHSRTFGERMKEYPIRIESLSRFKTPKEQKAIVAALAEGAIDVVIGTHRLVQADVKFKDLGLVVIDEEQRFGVEHKEFLKKLRATVDVLTLTATPIPRTLHMSLLGIRDISTLQTPPQERIAVRTQVTLFDESQIREAILHEMDRGGQVYFVHNRVYNIEKIRDTLLRLVPEAKFGVGHGQMAAEELENAMIDFLEKKTDVLVCTTIIESGLDIPNVNTIFIHNADQFGLADLHQLRGRVGRYTVQAYCYLLLPRDRPILPTAKKRIKAIEEFSELGAGFKIAMRDLEIRGVGNLLGREQSGHIAAVGYDLYLKMLERASKKMKNAKPEEPVEAAVDLDVDAHIPEAYAADLKTRVEIYRRLTACRTEAHLADARKEIEDRFGPPPAAVENFLKVMRVKLLCRAWDLASLSRGREAWVAEYRDRKKAERLKALRPDAVRIADAKTLWILGDPLDVLSRGS